LFAEFGSMGSSAASGGADVAEFVVSLACPRAVPARCARPGGRARAGRPAGARDCRRSSVRNRVFVPTSPAEYLVVDRFRCDQLPGFTAETAADDLAMFVMAHRGVRSSDHHS
jgi:hypothetical protein